MSVESYRVGIPLVPPYNKGQGCDFTDFELFAEYEEGKSLSSGDLVILQPGNKEVIVDSVEAVDDYFESYTVLKVRLVSRLTVECLEETPKFVVRIASAFADSQRGVFVPDPTKLITIKLN